MIEPTEAMNHSVFISFFATIFSEVGGRNQESSFDGDIQSMLSHKLFDPSASRLIRALGKSLAIIEFDPSGTILSANENFCALMGYLPEEILGRHHSMFMDNEHAQSPEYKDFWNSLAQGQFHNREFRRFGKGGRQLWIQASYNPVLNARGKVVRVVKVASDTTAAHLRNAAFEAKLAAISRVQGVIEFTPDGTIIDANENFLSLMGYGLDEIKGRHHRMFVPDAYAASPEYRDFWRQLNEGRFVAAEFERFGKGGRSVWIQASYNPIPDNEGRITSIVKFATDITDRVQAVAEVANGLTELSNNNLQHRLHRAFVPAFEQLRVDYNASLSGLQATMTKVAASAGTVNTGTRRIVEYSGDMTARIEQQAASLQETAAALGNITETVKKSAEGALEAALAASGARAGTLLSGKVMNQAAEVMGEINASSGRISEVIGIIDEIAFQTNLLALNAGVEAARAGESGRGFAVVAQEVRGLAQRSALAAKEIKALITASSEQVKRGVALVDETAKALEGVTAKVGEIDAVLSAVAKSAQAQAAGLSKVNISVNRMDQVTHENAKMLGESRAAAQSLEVAAGEMATLIGEFRIDTEEVASIPAGRPRLVLVDGGPPLQRAARA